MTVDARILRIVARPNGVILHLDAYPGKLAVIAPTHVPTVGQRVSGDDGSAHVWDGIEGQGGMVACYQRKGLRLYERTGNEQPE